MLDIYHVWKNFLGEGGEPDTTSGGAWHLALPVKSAYHEDISSQSSVILKKTYSFSTFTTPENGVTPDQGKNMLF